MWWRAPDTELSREKVGLVQSCGLSKEMFGRIQLDDDMEPHIVPPESPQGAVVS